MTAPTITPAFGVGDHAYVISRARDSGILSHGAVSEIIIRVGLNGQTTPTILYRITINDVIAPPKGLFNQGNLCNEATAKALAKAYHERQVVSHQTSADKLS